jgi:hypothetical protein
LLLVLGVAFVRVGITAIGPATLSSVAVGLGTGAVVAAGLIAVFFCSHWSRLTVEKEASPGFAGRAFSLLCTEHA